MRKEERCEKRDVNFGDFENRRLNVGGGVHSREARMNLDPRHSYETLSLFSVGLVLGLFLVVVHLGMLFQPQAGQAFLKKFPRNPLLGQILMGIGLGWFWLLVAPENMGVLSSLCMDFGEFNSVKPLLRVGMPVVLVLVCISVRDFLAVRALGLVCLMAAAPLLEAAFLKEPVTRLLIPIYVYAIATAALFWVGKPYLFRDWVEWATATKARWNGLALAGLAYGVAVVVCALAFWRGC